MMLAISRPLHGPVAWSLLRGITPSGARTLASESGSQNEDRSAEDQSSSSGLTPGAHGGATAGSDEVPGPGPHKETGQAEGGTSGGIAGAWRAMTSSFSVGSDDMAGDNAAGTVAEDASMKVSPDDGLPPGPQETSGPAAAARAGGFGQTRDPQASEQADAPEDLAQKARDINRSREQQDASASGAKAPWSH